MFVGRDNELKELNNAINLDGLQYILVYGKRRIGKTELIKTALANAKDFVSINYQCVRTDYQDNIDKMSDLVCNRLAKEKLKLEKIEDILNFLSKESRDKKIILCIDEYPYLRELKQGIDDIFQHFIDSNRSKNIKIIFCGSYANIMEKMVSKDAALFGRLAKIISLKEMPYYDAFKLCPSTYSTEDKIRIYSIFGGVPYYYTFLNSKMSVEDNIINNVINNSSLLSEAEICLNNQLSKINSANSIFQAIASGKRNFGDIKDSIHCENPNNLDAPLKKLIEMELIEKKTCINAEKNKKNRIYYSICDNFFNFYYKYVFKYFNELNSIGPEKFFKFIKNDFEEKFVPSIFEKICLQYIKYLNINTEQFSFINLGSYYFDDPTIKKSGQFDIVGVDFEKKYTFFEVKYTNKKIDSCVVLRLFENVKKLNLKSINLGFISKNGFTSEAIKIIDSNKWILFELDDLLSIN